MAFPPQPPSIVAAQPACAGRLTLSLDGEDGAFDGMSHGGTLLVLRNPGPDACTVAGLPTLRFLDSAGRPLDLARKAPAGMHPGPVVLPATVPAGGEATATMTWVSGDVYDGHHCARPATLALDDRADGYSVRWQAQLCGPAGAPIPYQQTPFRTGRPSSP